MFLFSPPATNDEFQKGAGDQGIPEIRQIRRQPGDGRRSQRCLQCQQTQKVHLRGVDGRAMFEGISGQLRLP